MGLANPVVEYKELGYKSVKSKKHVAAESLDSSHAHEYGQFSYRAKTALFQIYEDMLRACCCAKNSASSATESPGILAGREDLKKDQT